MVAEMQKLLVTNGNIPSESEFVVLADVIENYDLLLLAEFLEDAVATEIVEKVDAEGTALTHRGEPYVYFDSPNSVYYQWLAEFGYKPAEKK